MPKTESERKKWEAGGGREEKRWADEITPAGLLALAAGVQQCDVP